MKPATLSHGLFLILFFSTLLANILMLAPYLLAIFMGIILSILCVPFFKRIRNRGISPAAAALLTTLALTAIIVLPATLFGSLAITQAIQIGKNISQSPSYTQFNLASILDSLPLPSALSQLLAERSDSLRNHFESFLQTGIAFLSTKTLQIAGSLPEILLQLTLALLSCLFLLKDGERLKYWFIANIPLDPKIRTAISESFQDTAASIMIATVAAALCQTFIILLGFLVLGIPGAFLASGLTFLFAWVPMVGATPIWLFGCLYFGMQGLWGKMIGMLIFGLIASVADNIIRPWILKGKSDMHPLVSLIAIFGGVSLFGILGVFIGPILIAVLISLIKVWPFINSFTPSKSS